MTTGQRIDTSKEIRQWIGLGMKLATLVYVAYLSIPGVKTFVDEKLYDINHKDGKVE